MEKTFRYDGVELRLDMEKIFTKWKFWLDEFANAPNYICVGFSSYDEYLKRKDTLQEGFPGFQWHKVENVCGEYRLSFRADTKENAYEWYHQNYLPLFREQAVEFFKENKYLPYNFKKVFCCFERGQEIVFSGKIPGWCKSLDSKDSVKCEDALKIKKSNNLDGELVFVDTYRQEYYMDSHSFFDYGKFIDAYVKPEHPDFHKVPECVKFVYGEHNVALAALCNKVDLIKKLVCERPDAVNKDIYDNLPGLVLAAKSGNFDVVNFLLENGAEVNREGYDALNSAVDNKNIEICRVLLEHGANPNSIFNANGCALKQAVLLGNKEIAKLLLEHGADPNSGGKHKETPIQAAIRSQKMCRFEIAEVLIEFGAVDKDPVETKRIMKIYENESLFSKWEAMGIGVKKVSLDEKIVLAADRKEQSSIVGDNEYEKVR